ncbi:MAG TPA: TRAP transporter small permease [Methylomirabilota bacterium]|jgi:TRAP-type C4-dicarboxylate transport system permease small subunit|nr:TRAP transporter small permease [Methylomirabilota bacterium]
MIARLSWAAALLSGLATLVIAVLISADVLLRYFINSPLLFVDEVASFLLVLVIFGGLAYTFRCGAHVRVDLATTHLPPPVRAWLRAAGLLLGIGFVLVVSWTTLQSAITAYRYGRVSTVMLYPLWAPMLLIPAGLLLMSAVMAGALRRQLRAALGPRAGRDEVPPSAEPR